jgi:succinoglycan biosynthesis protein ExoM
MHSVARKRLRDPADGIITYFRLSVETRRELNSNLGTHHAPLSGVAVGVCTYKRLPLLRRTLAHVGTAAAAAGQAVHLIVVDNDGSDAAVGEAVMAFAASSGLNVHYLVESTPGIAAARNAVFGQAQRLGVRFMAMLDDDEWPDPQWIVALLKAQSQSGASVVGGPVRPVFPEAAAHLRRFARYWSVEPQLLHGKPFVFCSCNFLIDLAAIAEEPRPLFDQEFGLSGGEDTVFFRKLFFKGHPMSWSDEALVFEEVPEARASFDWMRRRRFGVGNHAVRWERMGGRFRTALKTLGLTCRLAIYPLLRREPESPLVGWLLELEKVRGRYAAHFGGVFMGYARPDGSPNKACR